MGKVIEKVNDHNRDQFLTGQAERVFMIKEGIPLQDLLSQRKLLIQLYDIEEENEEMIVFKKKELTMNWLLDYYFSMRFSHYSPHGNRVINEKEFDE